MWRWTDVKMNRCEDVSWEDDKMRRSETEKMWRCEDEKVKMRRCGDEHMWRCKMRRCEDARWEDDNIMMWRC